MIEMKGRNPHKTYHMKGSEVEKKWYIVDATDLVLGRLASIVAMRLMGKHKPTYTPSMDCGDNIVIINAEKVALTGNKMKRKTYFWHTGYPGGIKSRTADKIIGSEQPEKVIEKAVKNMLGHGPMARKRMTNLHIFKGSEHTHAAQKPEKLDIASMNRKNKKGE